jgi:type IV secretion system protein VirD4
MAVPSPIKIGYYFDSKKQSTGAPNLFAGERHLLIFGLNGAGKSTRFLTENLVTLKNRSIVVFDIKGELAAMTARTRKKFSDVKIINPYGVVGLPSDGYNPLAILDPSNDNEFSDRAAMLADAIIEMEGKDPHWSESAQGLMQAGIMWEVQEAVREDREPSLFRVRQLLTQADESELGADGKRHLVKGLAINATKMVEGGGEIIASLVGRFLREHGQNELSSIQSTFDTQTRFLLSPPLQRDLEKKDGVDFRQLREKPTTVYIVLPPNEINRKRRWTRLLISAALCEHMRPGPVKTLFVLDEFRASVGHLQIISDVWSLVRGYGIQLMPVVQSATQLEKLFEREWENFAAQAGAVVTIGPPNDMMTANWMSEISGNETIWQDQRSSGESSNQQGGGVNFSDGLNYGQAERRFLLPQELRSMADGTGRIWTPGMGECSIPFFAPTWWHVSALKGLVDPNPYHQDGSEDASDASSQTATPPSAGSAGSTDPEAPRTAASWLVRAVGSSKNLAGFVGGLTVLFSIWAGGAKQAVVNFNKANGQLEAQTGILVLYVLSLCIMYWIVYGITFGLLWLLRRWLPWPLTSDETT